MATSFEFTHFCKICGLTFEKLSLYLSHATSFDHKFKELQLDEDDVAEKMLPNQNESPGNHAGIIGGYRCQECDIYVTGLIPLEQHISGSKHQKKLRYKQLMEKGKASSPITSRLNLKPSETIEEKIQSSSSSSLAKCDSNEDDEVELSRHPTTVPILYQISCQPCGKIFSGVQCYQQHVASAMHYRRCHLVEGKNAPVLASHVCTVCNVNFTGSIPFQQHMQGLKHSRQVERNRRWLGLALIANDNDGDGDGGGGEDKSCAAVSAERDAEWKREYELWDKLTRDNLSKRFLVDDITCTAADEPVNLSNK